MILRHLFLALVLFWAFVPARWTILLSVSGVDTTLKDASLLASAAIFLATAIANGKFFKLERLVILFHALLLFCAISVTWNQRDHQGVVPITLALAWASFWTPFFIVKSISREERKKLLAQLSILAVCIAGLYGAQSLFELGFRQSHRSFFDLGIERLQGPLFSATVGQMMLLPALAFFLSLCELPWLVRIACICVLSMGMLLQGSRGGLLCLALFILGVVLRNAKSLGKIVGYSFASIAVLVLTMSYVDIDLSRLMRWQDSSNSDRIRTMNTGLYLFDVSPVEQKLVGSGYGSIWGDWYSTDIQNIKVEGRKKRTALSGPLGDLLYHPHSVFLMALVELGIFGLLLILGLVAVLFQEFRSMLGSKASWMGIALLATLLTLIFDLVLFKCFQISSIWWMYVFLGIHLHKDLQEPASVRHL